LLPTSGVLSLLFLQNTISEKITVSVLKYTVITSIVSIGLQGRPGQVRRGRKLICHENVTIGGAMNGFTWPVAVKGYEWLEFPDYSRTVWLLQPIQKWPVRHYEPLKEYTGLFRTFAKVEPTKEGILAFANQFGVLGAGPTVEGFKNVRL